jgi:hypothetical protein
LLLVSELTINNKKAKQINVHQTWKDFFFGPHTAEIHIKEKLRRQMRRRQTNADKSSCIPSGIFLVAFMAGDCLTSTRPS